MPRNQFFRRELLPGVDIDAVAIRDAKQALRFTHNRADALISRVDQLDAGNESPSVSRIAVAIAFEAVGGRLCSAAAYGRT